MDDPDADMIYAGMAYLAGIAVMMAVCLGVYALWRIGPYVAVAWLAWVSVH